jgi:general nucleoside transport system ATP-binding protein
VSDFAIRMRGIGKRFGNVQALEGVDLEVERGAVHAIVGENGAGKTTLMRILYGALHADAGTLEVDGQVRNFRSSAEAIGAGVGMVSQHYGIVPELTCLQNLMLGAEPGFLIDRPAAVRRAQDLAAQMGFAFDWHRDAETLSPAGAQKLEILKLLWRRARTMVLDEPTAMLSPADSDALFESLKKLVAEDATVLLVTHRLPEVFQFCSRVTVLRAGRLVADMPVAETNAEQLARLIVGGALDRPALRAPVSSDEVALELDEVTVRGSRKEEALKGVSLRVRRGEMVGIAGVDGNGQRELVQSILGLLQLERGSILLGGEKANRKSPKARLQAGVRLIPEDRHREGVIEDWSLEENAALGLQRFPEVSSGSFVLPARRREMAARFAERFSTRHGGLHMPMRSLSGGNQQRFVAARALGLSPKLILAFQPARGLDLNGTLQVYEGIRRECERGAAAVVVSFDLDELLEHCDRLVAINHGRLFEPPRGAELDRDAIGRLMVGAE